jgi:hypothetical protein
VHNESISLNRPRTGFVDLGFVFKAVKRLYLIGPSFERFDIRCAQQMEFILESLSPTLRIHADDLSKYRRRGRSFVFINNVTDRDQSPLSNFHRARIGSFIFCSRSIDDMVTTFVVNNDQSESDLAIRRELEVQPRNCRFVHPWLTIITSEDQASKNFNIDGQRKYNTDFDRYLKIKLSKKVSFFNLDKADLNLSIPYGTWLCASYWSDSCLIH